MAVITFFLFQQEPNNLRNLNSFRFNGLVHQQAVGIQPASDGKGVVLVTKNKKGNLEGQSGIAFSSDKTWFICILSTRNLSLLI